MKKTVLLCTLSLFFFGKNEAQVVGGDNVFEFVNLSPSARITALGGHLITVRDDDVNLAYQAPSLLNPSMHGQVSFGNHFFQTGINHGYAAYGHYLEKWDATMHGGVQYIRYGTFDETDEIGNVLGQFSASEYAFTAGIGKELYERLSVGANLKFVTSSLESYQSNGLLADFSATFHDTSKLVNFTLLFKNVGWQISTYSGGKREPVPFEMQAGISKRLRHLPFRFSIIYRYLDRYNILYDDPNSQEDTFFFGDETASANNNFLDNFSRHFIFSGEFLFGQRDNFRLRVGYNHLQRKELTVRNLRSLTGFSMGVGLKVNRFRIDFARTVSHLGAGTTHLGISTNFKEFMK